MNIFIIYSFTLWTMEISYSVELSMKSVYNIGARLYLVNYSINVKFMSCDIHLGMIDELFNLNNKLSCFVKISIVSCKVR